MKSIIKKLIPKKMQRFFKRIYQRIFLKKENKFIHQRYTYSIITPVFNSEKYLDDYFMSILIGNKEYLNFVEIIIIDDGSKDGSFDIIEKWKTQYPEVIKYYYQENKGQSSARNAGIKMATNELITFIDSDDFIGEDYFSNIDFALQNEEKVPAVILTKLFLYYEENDEISDSHPLSLKFNFDESYKKISLVKNPDAFQLSISCAILKREEIINNNLFLESIEPHFEDAKFLFEYMLRLNDFENLLVKQSKYFYRKRANNTSTINKSVTNKKRYIELLKVGYLDILKKYADTLQKIPKFLQYAILYEVSWNFLDYDTYKIYLSPSELDERENTLKVLFSMIDYNNILESKMNKFWGIHSIGINAKYYQNNEKMKAAAYYFYETNSSYIYNLVSIKNEWTVYIKNKKYSIKDFEYIKYDENMNQSYFVTNYYVSIPKKICSSLHELEFTFNNIPTYKSVADTEYNQSQFNESSIILFFDRRNKADDNAEVFYEWMMNMHPEYKQIYFIIDADTTDYQRLFLKGFNLVAYGSRKFELLYKKADYIFSSSFDANDMENYNMLRHPSFTSRAKFIFLQHGITTNNINEWIRKKRFNHLIIGSHFESLAMKTYDIFESQIFPVGFPRFDRLESIDTIEKTILFCFTWRNNVDMLSEADFMKTEYYNQINSAIHDLNLKKILEENGYKIKVLFHPRMDKYKKCFFEDNLSNIELLKSTDFIYYEEINSASLLITDYSSVAYDFVYLEKPILYYQFDNKNFFESSIVQKGIDYFEDGLGEVVLNQPELINKITFYIEHNMNIEEKYLERKRKFFLYNDKNNCERLFESLKKCE